MYKSKLQEFCHKNQWGLPKYTSMRYGPDHNPRFGASVSVNGTSFDSLLASKSNKEAHNHAAMLAFLHFTSPPPPGSEPAPISPIAGEIDQNSAHSNVSGLRNGKELKLGNSMMQCGSKSRKCISGKDFSLPVSKPNNGSLNIEETYQILKMKSDDESVNDDIQCQYKNLLQMYARQRNLDLPIYSCECDQGPHASHFKARVTVGDQIFESPEFFNTLKEAESDAAKAALMSLLVACFEEDESRAYKNLLQELVQREDLSVPIYKTTKCGEPHKPIFFSTVELEGEIFRGKAAKSKKQAELEAARAAYVALKERGSTGSTPLAKLTSPDFEGHAPKSTPTPGVACDSLQHLKHAYSLAPYPSQNYEESVEKNDSAIPSTVDSSSSSAISPQMGKMNRTEIVCPCSESKSTSPSESLVSPSFRKLNALRFSVSNDSNLRNNNTTGVKSYLLCNKVRVYQQFPNYAFPKDITVLPISDDKWVAVSLEFPNEEKNRDLGVFRK